MAKGGKVDSKGKVQQVYKRPKGQKVELPINTAVTNVAGDKQTIAIAAGIATLSALLVTGGLVFCGLQLSHNLSHSPLDWVAIISLTVCSILILLIARSLVWLSLLGGIMYSARVQAWKSQEKLCRAALAIRPLIPGGASTASFVLAQNMIGQEKFEEATQIGTAEWQRSGESAKADQNLALLCTTVGLARQLEGEVRDSITWNERAIQSFEKILESVKNPKGFMAKMAASQAPHWAGTVHLHLAVAHVHNANSHFNTQNFRAAKENYKKALDHANQAPDTQEKKDILQLSREQLSRLKHA